MSDVDCTIIGGGIVGCAVADAMANLGLGTVLLEMDASPGRGTTSRNSEVAHGGMYYPAGSLKARCCVSGRRLLKEFCAEAGVAYCECGKLIVAVDRNEIPELERLFALGSENGVEDLVMVDQAEMKRLEPDVAAVAGLLSPRTGILDAEGAARAYSRRAEAGGVQIMTGVRATALARRNEEWQVEVTPWGAGRLEGWTHSSRLVVNAAGLWADRVAALAGVDIGDRGWGLHLTKGNYFSVDSAHAGRVSRLIYPVPPAEGSSLGVHVCLDLGGQMKLGPDLERLGDDPRDAPEAADGRQLNYRVDPARGDAFWEDASRFLPWLRREDLTPAMSGLRPKLARSGFADFVVQREEGVLAGLVNLVGIESPGLTAAPALAQEVARLVSEVES